MTSEPAVQLDEVSKLFDDPETARPVVAVDRASFSVAGGEMVTLLGPSGCGKTTTLRIIGGFETPTSGRVLIHGRDMGATPPNKRDTAMVFQSYALFPHMSVFNNIAYGLKVRKTPAAAIRDKVGAALKTMELAGLDRRLPAQLSGGQQQRVALTRAVVIEPGVLLFDEPLSNLDARLRVQMRNQIRSLQKRLGITSIYVTHDQEEAMAISDRIIIMNHGRIEQIGAPREIYERPCSRFVADFFGLVNFIPARVVERRDRGVLVRFADREFLVGGSPPPETAAGDPVTVVVRPEAIALGRGPDAVPGVVCSAVYLGSLVEYDIDMMGIPVKVVEPDPRRRGVVEPGGAVGLGFGPDSFHLLPRAPAKGS